MTRDGFVLVALCLRSLLASSHQLEYLDRNRLLTIECEENGNAPWVESAMTKFGKQTVWNARTESLIWEDGDKTCFHVAAESGNRAVVALLLGAGIDILQKDAVGNTALHFAAQGDSAEIAALLLDAGVQVGVINVFRLTPLHVAAARGSIEVIRLLLDRGADVEAEIGGRSGETPMFQASWKNQPEAIVLLAERGAAVDATGTYSNGRPRLTALSAAVEWKAADAIRELVRLGASVEKAAEIKSRSSRFREGMRDPDVIAAIREGKALREAETAQ